jgi:hypothetical protein
VERLKATTAQLGVVVFNELIVLCKEFTEPLNTFSF